jgi:hypothetical protein
MDKYAWKLQEVKQLCKYRTIVKEWNALNEVIPCFRVKHSAPGNITGKYNSKQTLFLHFYKDTLHHKCTKFAAWCPFKRCAAN